MAASPGNSASSASSCCTVRHLIDAVCKIRRQKQCATIARIHKAVRQQLQRNVEVDEVLEQLNIATSTGELWRVDNNGVTSYREPPKGTSKEHLKWSADKHARWPAKDQQSGQFMMGHVKYPQSEHLNQPVNDHLSQRTHEHLPWTVTEQLRSSTAEPLRDHAMEPSRCSVNEPFMWPMTESMRWPAMNDPMSWPAAEPLRQASVETVPQQRSETASWPMNEPFRRPVNDPLAWQVNQSLRGQMAEQFAWHVTEPLRHPMVDPLTWPVPEPLRRPMAEQWQAWPGNDQLRRSIPEPLGWPVATPESFRRPTTAEHFNWCSPDAVRQTPKDTYSKPVKDTSLLARNFGDVSTAWPTRDATHAAHNSAKALSRSMTNSQKDSYKVTSASTFACPTSQQTMDTGVLPQHKNRSITPSTGNANNKFHSLSIPAPCKDMNSSCVELQRTCKQMPNMRKDMQLREGMAHFGSAENHYQPSSHSTGEVALMSNSQGFCLPRDGQYGCLSNCSGSLNDGEPHAMGPRRSQRLLGNEIAPQIPAITPVGSGQQGHLLEQPPCTGKSDASGKREDDGKKFRVDKHPNSLNTLPDCSATANGLSGEVALQAAQSRFQDPKTNKMAAEQRHTLIAEADSSLACHSMQSVERPSSFLSSDDKTADASSSQSTSTMSKSPALQFVLNAETEQMLPGSTAYKVESAEMKLPLSKEIDLGSGVSGSFSNSASKISEHCASVQSLTSSLDCISNLCQSSINCILKNTNDDQKPFSKDLISNDGSVIADCKVPDHLEPAVKSDSKSESQIVRCRKVSKHKRKLRNVKQASKKMDLNCNNITQITSAVQSAVRRMRGNGDDNGDDVTTRRIKSLILSKYKISSDSIWLLTRRIRQFCTGVVQSRWLQKKKRLSFKMSVKKPDGCQSPKKCDSDCGSKAYMEIPNSSNVNQISIDGTSSEEGQGGAMEDMSIQIRSGINPLNAMAGILDIGPSDFFQLPLVDDSCKEDAVKGNPSSPKGLPSHGPCSLLTDENQDLEMCRSVERSHCHQEDGDHQPSTTRSSGQHVDQGVEIAAEPLLSTSNHVVHGSISSVTGQSDRTETFVRSSQDELNEVDKVSEGDFAPVIGNQPETNPKGLIDGLTRFFTPSNKRSSRVSRNTVSRNTLQRTLEQIAKNRTSPKKAQLLSQVSQRRQKLRQPKAESFKAAQVSSSLSSGILKLEKKNLLHRKAPGRRREQLEDGLSHFFAVEGKRRSCTLVRSVGADSCMYSGRFDPAGNENLFSRCGDIRLRTRSLSLSETRDLKAPSSKKLQASRIDGHELDLSRPNVGRRGMILCGTRRSRTLSASTRSSQRSTSSLDFVKSPLSSNVKLLESSGHYPVAANAPSPGNFTMSCRPAGRRADADNFDAVHFKSDVVPSSLTKTSGRTPDQEKQLSCLSSSSAQNTNRLSSLSFYSRPVASSLCASFASTGRSAMVKLTRLSSEECSVLKCSGGSFQSEAINSVDCDEHLPVHVESTWSEVANARRTVCDGDTAVVLEAEEDLSSERPTTIDMAEAYRVVQPSMTPNDMILFRKAQKIAAERILVTHELNNLDPCQPSPPRVQIGQYELVTAYSSLYPPEFARLPKLFICEFCLKYLKSQCALQLHMAKCRQTCPPGSELYRADDLSVFEVGGDVSPIYCQNICLLARLFVGTKSPLQFNMSPFIFYILTLNDPTGSHLIGYFAKEKYSSSSCSISIVSLLVLPQHQKKGYGDFLIQLSYLICRLNKNPGSPLKPLSPDSSKVFESSWCKSIAECLRTYIGPERQLTIKDISFLTGIHPNDVSATLSSLQLIDKTKLDIGTVISVSDDSMEKLVSKWVQPFVDKRIRIDLKSLHWTKSSVQHILKTSLESAKLSTVVRRKSTRNIQQKRKEYDDDSVSDMRVNSKECESHCEFEAQGSLLRTTKRKNTSSLYVSPSKNGRLSSPESISDAPGDFNEKLFYDDRFETLEEEPNLNWSVKSSMDSVVKTSSVCGKSIMKKMKLHQEHGNGQSSVLSTGDQDPDFRIDGTAEPSAERCQVNSDSRTGDHRTHVDGVADCGTLAQQERVLEVAEAELKSVVEKKSVRSVEVQTDAYESEYSDDDSDESSSSSSSGSCSNCCDTSDESDSDEAEKKSESSVQPTCKSSVSTENVDAAKELPTGDNENESEDSSSSKDARTSSLESCTGVDSCATTTAAADRKTAEESLLSASCEVLNQGLISDLLTPESLDRVPDQLTPLSARYETRAQNGTIQLTETEEESGSQQLFGFNDSDKQSTYSKNTEFEAKQSRKTIDESEFQNNFGKSPVDTGKEVLSESFALQPGDNRHGGYIQDLCPETSAANDNFQFSSTHPSLAPNLAIESPLSMNSSSELGSCNVERTPSQAFSDCAQVHSAYGLENVGASPACGFVNSQNFAQITSPGCSSQITSPVSNHSFNITRCSPAVGKNAAGCSGTPDTLTSQQLNLSSQHPAVGTTFKMPVEDNRYATSSAYPVNGYTAAMASLASVGQCSYMGQYTEQSPGGQCNVINQNSPNGLGYNMPTPSPTNSSSRSFNMASPNTNAYHGQPTVSHGYDRSCPSAPVLSYARVIPQQLTSAADSVPWTHIYPPQAAGYSLIKFPDQELVPQHAVALPRNLLPPQPTVAVQQHLTQVNLVPLTAKPAKCPTTSASTTSKQHRRCGKSCKGSASNGLSAVRSQTVAPNVTIQPGTNMITSYNVINMNVDYRAQHPAIAAYPSSPYISNAAFINDAQQMQGLNIYQHRAISFPRQPQSHNNVYTAAYGYINGAIAQQSFNINVNGIMRQ